MKVNIAQKVQNKEGFTLVELMIVVAIIGILAAIAIPQFAAYRIRGYNASAQSDVRNTNTSQAAYFSDWATYGITEFPANLAAATGGTGAGAVVGMTTAAGLPVITSFDNGATVRALQIPIGNGVSVIATTDVQAAGTLSVSGLAIAKHLQGDTFFGVDGDSTAVYQDNSSAIPATAVGYLLTTGDEPASTTADDFVLGGAVNGPSTQPWTVK